MYDSNHFEKSKMMDWEKKTSITKAVYTAAKDYFEELVRATDIYTQNAGAGTARRNKFKSANHMADFGNNICEYIANLASTSAAQHMNRPPTPWARKTNLRPWLHRFKPSQTPLPN